MTRARERIRTSLDESLIVEASAGTGKTTELVRRIVAVLESGQTTIDRIAAVTFTHKAAGELKLRLREELDKARRRAPLLEDALERLEEASIGTIHSFCAQILRERPVEARVDPAFEELNEQESDRLYQRAFRAWLERSLDEPSPGLRRAFARLAWRDSWDDSPPLEQLQWAGRKLVEWRDYPAPWHREPFEREEEIDTIVRLVRRAGGSVCAPAPRDRQSVQRPGPGACPGGMDRACRSAAGSRDYDALESLAAEARPRPAPRLEEKARASTARRPARRSACTPRRTAALDRGISPTRRCRPGGRACATRCPAWSTSTTSASSAAGKLDFVDLLILRPRSGP